MAINASSITTSNTLEQLRQEFNNLVTDVSGLESGSKVFSSISATETSTTTINVLEDGTIIFEGATDDAHETTLTVVDPTADRTVSLPNASGTVIVSDSSTNVTTLPDDLLIKDGGTIGNASVADVMTLAATGIVTFKDDLLIKDGGTIGSASSTSAITIASTGIVTFVEDIVIKDGGTIGSASSTGAITIASSGIVTLVDDLLIKDGGTIGNASVADVMTLASTGIVTFKDDIIIKDGGTFGTSTTPAAMTIASGGAVTFSATPVFPDGSIAIADLDIDGGTDIGADLASTDLIIVDDGAGGTNRKAALSRVTTLTDASATALAIALG